MTVSHKSRIKNVYLESKSTFNNMTNQEKEQKYIVLKELDHLINQLAVRYRQ